MESIQKIDYLTKQMCELKKNVIENFAQTQEDEFYMHNFHDHLNHTLIFVKNR